MKRVRFIKYSLFFLSFFQAITSSYAGTPVWTFTPLTATTISVAANGTATVQYQVKNQSNRVHTLAMSSIMGVLQTTTGPGICGNPFTLSGHGSCTLSLQIDSSQVASGSTNGPIVCEFGSVLQCYKPSLADILNITATESQYSLGGSISGLTDTVYLQNNGVNPQAFSSNGPFTFATPVAAGSPYNVTVQTQPAGQTCIVSNGSGTMGGSNVTNVAVSCTDNTTTLTTSLSSLALSVNDTSLNVALTGNPRQITITNTGSVDATNVVYNASPALPSGTSISPSSCGTVSASGGTCVITITPGVNPSAAPGDTNPTPITLTISGDNTNTLNPEVSILTYGSVYQSGYIYSVDDTTSDTGSIGGKVAALTDQSVGVIWSSDGSSAVSYVAILAIDELSTPLSPSPTSPSYPPGTPAYNACNGNSDGVCNTSNIVSYYNFNRASGGAPPTPLDQYAAGLCKATISGASDWYLPSICEEGYDGLGSGTGCGTQASPTIQNMLSNLFDAGVGGFSGEYWSSTEWSSDPHLYAWSQTFDLGNIPQNAFDKSYNTIKIRCSRALTP